LKNIYHRILSYIWCWLKKESIYSVQSPQLFIIYSGLISHLKNNIPQKENFIAKSDSKNTGYNSFNLLLIKFSCFDKEKDTLRISQIMQYFCMLTPSEIVIEIFDDKSLSFPSLANSIEVEYQSYPMDDLLFSKLNRHSKIDFIYFNTINAEKIYELFFQCLKAKIQNKSIIMIAKIHFTPEMDELWNKMKSIENVKLALDFFNFGVLFFDPDLPKINRILEY